MVGRRPGLRCTFIHSPPPLSHITPTSPTKNVLTSPPAKLLLLPLGLGHGLARPHQLLHRQPGRRRVQLPAGRVLGHAHRRRLVQLAVVVAVLALVRVQRRRLDRRVYRFRAGYVPPPFYMFCRWDGCADATAAFTGNWPGRGGRGGRDRDDDDDRDDRDDDWDDVWDDAWDWDWDNDSDNDSDDRWDDWRQWTRTWTGGVYTVTGCEWAGNVWAGGPGGCGRGCSPWYVLCVFFTVVVYSLFIPLPRPLTGAASGGAMALPR